MRPTMFGRKVMHDGLFVSELRRGRAPRPSTVARVRAFLDRAERELGMKPCRKRR